jgi:GNAT superfamily N-acetyltransferase
MPLAARAYSDSAPELEPLPGLDVRRERDVALMAALQSRSEDEMARRFADGHRAYVARYAGSAAAWGWVATRHAEIGELGTSFPIPDGDRYLWNFVTLKSHRGLGIYPRLLDAIVHVESPEAERFWVAYAPENHASGSGIRKAGFVAMAELSFDRDGRPAVRGLTGAGESAAARLVGLPQAADALTPCWRCVRAGRGAMACAAGQCHCDYQRPETECADAAHSRHVPATPP